MSASRTSARLRRPRSSRAVRTSTSPSPPPALGPQLLRRESMPAVEERYYQVAEPSINIFTPTTRLPSPVSTTFTPGTRSGRVRWRPVADRTAIRHQGYECAFPSPPCLAANGVYGVLAPTAFSDRVCTAVTVCSGPKFELKQPTHFTDRVFQNVKNCIDNVEYETKAPNPTADRGCKPLTTCTYPQYETAPAQSTVEHDCTPTTTCKVTEYDSELATATRDHIGSPVTPGDDRVCKFLTQRAADQFETKAAFQYGDRSCKFCSHCSPMTEYQTVALGYHGPRVRQAHGVLHVGGGTDLHDGPRGRAHQPV
jgi:hypothetical protein